MITCYLQETATGEDGQPVRGPVRRSRWEENTPLPEGVVWIDLVAPTHWEERLAETLIGAELPTQEEMAEIETSSRLYVENGAIYLTATLLCGISEGAPGTTPVTFIVANNRLVTVRYDEPKAFPLAGYRLLKQGTEAINGAVALTNLLDAVVERMADILEAISAEIEAISRAVFEAGVSDRRTEGPNYHDIIRAIGRQGMLTNRAQESLLSMTRTVAFLSLHTDEAGLNRHSGEMKSMTRDVRSLSDHAASLDAKINFLLDAVLGLVNLDQSAIIKIFSVLAVVFMPPTLIASVYGMNFQHMPELEWQYGYEVSIALMFISAVGTYGFFRWKRWL